MAKNAECPIIPVRSAITLDLRNNGRFTETGSPVFQSYILILLMNEDPKVDEKRMANKSL